MTFAQYFKIATREIKNSRKFALFFAFNLTLGLSGFVVLDVFKQAMETALLSRSQSIMGADLSLGARRPLTEAELKTADTALGTKVLASTNTIETFSMLVGKNKSRLVELKAIESAYPFYGEIELTNGGIKTGASPKSIIEKPEIWAYPELLVQLGLKVGDTVKIGDKDFLVADTISKDASGVGSGFSFALPVYIGLEQLKKTSLLTFGTTGFFSRLYKVSSNENTKDLSKLLFDKYEDPAIQVTSHEESSEQIGRFFGQVNDYLGLAALVALFLTALGTSFLFRTFLFKRFRDIAIFKSLGFTNLQIDTIFALQVLILGTLSTIPLLLLIGLATPLLDALALKIFAIEISSQFSIRTISLAFLTATLGSFLVILPLFAGLRSIQAKDLFQAAQFSMPRFNLRMLLSYTPAALGFLLLSFWISKSFRVGGFFFAAFAGALLILVAIGYGILKSLKWLPLPRLFPLKMAFRHLVRQPFTSLAIFLSVSLGITLMNLIPQIQTTLTKEVERPSGVKIPSLFLFDIQDEQVPAIREIVASTNNDLIYVSPMIRARLIRVNDEPFVKANRNNKPLTREEENENRSRNRGYNLTYREKLSDSETIIEGPPIEGRFDPAKQKLPYLSLETRFAERLKLKIGDKLAFEIQGLEVEGEVRNMRKVKWTSFQPNFFISFQEGVLEDAPKTYLAGVPALPIETKEKLEQTLVEKLPNVSIIEVSQAVERLSSILNQMTTAIQIMAFLSVFVGLSILFSIANQQAFERRSQVNLLKVLGSGFSDILTSFLFEFGIITALASLCGTALSFLVSELLARYIFESEASFNFALPALLATVTIAISLLVTWLAIRNVLESQPRELLSQS